LHQLAQVWFFCKAERINDELIVVTHFLQPLDFLPQCPFAPKILVKVIVAMCHVQRSARQAVRLHPIALVYVSYNSTVAVNMIIPWISVSCMARKHLSLLDASEYFVQLQNPLKILDVPPLLSSKGRAVMLGLHSRSLACSLDRPKDLPLLAH
jgi:hypothetical protein